MPRQRQPEQPTGAALCRINVVEDAAVVPRGERVTYWFVRHNLGWLRVRDFPDAALEEETNAAAPAAAAGGNDERCPPGTVWTRRFELRVPRGTLLLRRQTLPREVDLDPMQYLQRGLMRVPRERRETEFKVVANYRLVRSKPDPKPDRR